MSTSDQDEGKLHTPLSDILWAIGIIVDFGFTPLIAAYLLAIN
jgi:hypothetical protein